MKLDIKETKWIKQNEYMIRRILEKRIEGLKDELLDVEEKKREIMILFIKEYKSGLGLLTELTTEKKQEDITGV